MELGIEGRVALVVAGSRGLGRATAEALAGEGAKVMLSARDQGSLNAAQTSMQAAGADVATVVADITDPAAPSAASTS
jgi:3-oxoacyl-[acyl-carrier protein] reductase